MIWLQSIIDACTSILLYQIQLFDYSISLMHVLVFSVLVICVYKIFSFLFY